MISHFYCFAVVVFFALFFLNFVTMFTRTSCFYIIHVTVY